MLHSLFTISFALLAGLLMTRAFKPFKLPAVTAYLIAGVLIGPYCIGGLGINDLGFTSMDSVAMLSVFSQVALGFIAFSIGNEFRLEELKHIGRQAVVIGIFQAITATALVDLALFAVHLMMPDKLSIAQALTLGAIASMNRSSINFLFSAPIFLSGSLFQKTTELQSDEQRYGITNPVLSGQVHLF